MVVNLAEKRDEKLNPMFANALKKSKVDKKPTTKSKGSASIDNLPQDVKAAIDKFVKAKAAMKAAKADMLASEPMVIDAVREIQDKNGYADDFRKSYDVTGINEKVKYVTQNKFSINGDDSDEIKELLGDAYDALLEDDYDVRLRPEVLKNADLQEELMTLLKGGELFDKFFYTHVTIKANKDFDSKVYKHVDASDLDALRIFVKQNKPSLR